jgi:hypothetical protein
MRAMVEAVLALDEPYRSTVILRFYQNQPPRAIAAIDRVAVATVNSRLQRALAKLRANLRRDPRLHGIVSLAGFSLARTAASTMSGGMLVGTKTLAAIAAGIVVVGSLAWLVVIEGGASTAARQAIDPTAESRAGAAAPVLFAAATPAPERTAAEPSPAPVAASTGEPQAAPVAARELDPVTASFLTAQPNLPGLLEMVRTLSVGATVDTESVKPSGGGVVGRLVLADAAIEATFRIEKGRFQVDIKNPAGKLPSPFMQGNLYLSFVERDGNASDAGATVQFHPDTRRSSAEFLGEKEERYVGWNVDIGREGARALPIAMRRQDTAWVVGHSETLAPIDDRYVQDTTPFNPWLRLLAPHAR